MIITLISHASNSPNAVYGIDMASTAQARGMVTNTGNFLLEKVAERFIPKQENTGVRRLWLISHSDDWGCGQIHNCNTT